jgi:hypothetical protein
MIAVQRIEIEALNIFNNKVKIMNGRCSFFNLACYVMYFVISINLFCLFSINVYAQENHYQLNEIVQLDSELDKSSQWLELISSPSNAEEYFAFNSAGQMYLVDEMQKLTQVLNLNTKNENNGSSIRFTAVELHPNFALRDQLGYGIFYTAHIEKINNKSSTKRIEERKSGMIFKFDAVITEWQFYSSNYQAIDPDAKREVLRISVPDNKMTINQMSFNPYTKSWNEDFGLLYIALNGDKKWPQPLYSGVVLRINPATFGLRSFTVPASNPYIKESGIKNEIYLLGAQTIKQFIWPDKSSDTILLSHQYNNKFLLSLTELSNDWRNKSSKDILYQSDRPIDNILLYRGSSLMGLRNKLLLLTNKKEGWLVESLSITPSMNTVNPVENRLKQEWQFTSEQLAYNSDVSFSENRDGEVLVINKTSGKVIQVSQNTAIENDISPEKSVTVVEHETGSTDYIYIALIIFVLIGGGFYFVKRNKFSAKAIVHKQFADIELSESQQQIGFYYRHSKTINTIINISEVVTFEVKLNDITVNVINQHENQGFSNGKEQTLRAIFAKEKLKKMTSGKIRQISLVLTDTQKKSYIVCLYMRKGSDRVTKKTYSVAIEDLIDWCWLIAETINLDSTELRKKKPAIFAASIKKVTERKVSKTQGYEYEQSVKKRVFTNKKAYVQQELENMTPPKIDLTNQKIETTDQLGQKKRIDTELVNALEKLVDLKKQGFLTQEEFIKTKENLLRSLSE